MKILFLFFLVLSNSVFAKPLSSYIDILEQESLFELEPEVNSKIYPEVSISGDYYRFSAALKIINKNLENSLRYYFGGYYQNFNDKIKIKQHHTFDLSSGFEIIFENSSIFKPFMDLSQGYSRWHHRNQETLVDNYGSAFNRAKIGLYISFADQIKFFARHQATSYWGRPPFHLEGQKVGRTRFVVNYGFSLVL
jgi:hypothetical protein